MRSFALSLLFLFLLTVSAAAQTISPPTNPRIITPTGTCSLDCTVTVGQPFSIAYDPSPDNATIFGYQLHVDEGTPSYFVRSTAADQVKDVLLFATSISVKEVGPHTARVNAFTSTSAGVWTPPWTFTAVEPTPTEVCGDKIDNDGDGQIDEDCPPPAEVCGDKIDNDGDGQIDEDCPSQPEVCNDKIDNDGDGQIDEGCPTLVILPGTSTFGWTQKGPASRAEAESFNYEVFIDPGQPTESGIRLSGVVCQEQQGPDGWPCTALIPATSVGKHEAELRTVWTLTPPSNRVEFVVEQPDARCVFPTGTHSVTIFPTRLVSGGERAGVNFQIASAADVTQIDVLLRDELAGTSTVGASVKGTQLTDIGGVWFQIPPSRRRVQIRAVNAIGCTATVTTSFFTGK